MNRLEAYVALNLAPQIGPVRVRRLREHFGDVTAIFTATGQELQRVEGIGSEAARSLQAESLPDLARAELARAEASGIKIIDQEDEGYPALLREIYDPPLVLYGKGVWPTSWPAGIALVGSRTTSHYGQEMARKFGYQLAYAGLPVVSGLARGIDTSAHLGALAAKGVTWAVLGCGLDQCYPAENEELAQRITEKGLVLSEFPLGTKPDRQTFPMRNRIVSGLSFGVLVVEAALESGALITARQALDQGRQVFAIPGRIDTPHARGSNRLIKEGAKLVEEVTDILGEMEMLFPALDRPVAHAAPADLSESERKILEAIGDEEYAIDLLITKTGLPSATVSSTLLRLEMRRLVRQLPGKIFVRIE